MRTYETIFIVHPDVVGDALEAVIEKYKKILTDEGANVLKAENWGTRTLAYLVKKQSKGCYILMIFDGPPTAIAEFERRMRIDEAIIKFQTVLLEGGYQAPAEKASVEEAEAAESDEDESATEFEED
jgi:small subunit ribosomal protein S6